MKPSEHAFLILAHNNFDLLEKLIKAMDDKRNELFIHIYKKCVNFDFTYFSTICSSSSIHFTNKRIDVSWGTEKLVDAEMILFSEAAKKGPLKRYHLISGADLPIKSNDYIHNFFENNEKEYIVDR